MESSGTRTLTDNTIWMRVPSAPVQLSFKQGVTLLLLLLILNSILAALGSLVWRHFPYWPAFMVYTLVCVYFRPRICGVVLAVLTPSVSSLLAVGGAPAYLYAPVNLLQALLAIAAFERFRIDFSLDTWSDRIKYLCLAIALPSFLGGCFAWTLRLWSSPDSGDPDVLHFASWWMAENLVPAVFPGILLHERLAQMTIPALKRVEEKLARQQCLNYELRRRIEELEASAVARDSHNSSLPPALDPPAAKGLTPSGERGACDGLRAGGPALSPATSGTPPARRAARPGRDALPALCRGCGASLSSGYIVNCERRQVVEPPPVRPRVVEHRALTERCRSCDELTKGRFPKGVKAAVQYGRGVAGARRLPRQLPTAALQARRRVA